MIKLLAILSFLVAIGACAEPNINKGNWEVGGSASLSRTYSFGNEKTYFYLSPRAQYFFADLYSAGLDADYSKLGGYHSYSLAPVITKYFSVKDRWTPYFSLSPIGVTKSNFFASRLFSEARLGVKYFLTDSVAIGTTLSYEHFWPTNQYKSEGNINGLVDFSVYL